MSLKPLLSAILVASKRIFLSHAQTPMCASILPNFALLYPKYPNEVMPKNLSADCLASYLSLSSSLFALLLSSLYLSLFPTMISIARGTMPFFLWQTFQSSSGILLVEDGQHEHLTVSAERFFFSMMLG